MLYRFFYNLSILPIVDGIANRVKLLGVHNTTIEMPVTFNTTVKVVGVFGND